MKKTNRIKFALDVLMLLILLLMYNKNVLGLGFHEIGGMAVCGLFIIHKLLSGKWILAVSGKLLSKTIPWRVKLNWLIDFLLLLCFIYILVSGIFISRILFDGQRGTTVFKIGHFAVSALALALLGVHLGLHYEWILKRTPARRLPLKFRRVAAMAVSILILIFGVYQMTATSFLSWMSNLGMVVNVTSALPEGGTGEFPLPFFTEGTEDGALPAGEDGEEHSETGRGGGRVNGGEGMGLGKGNGAAGYNEYEISTIGDVLLGFLSITLAFSVIVAWIDGAQRAVKCGKRLKSQLPA